jgi:hypothetical protein
MKSGIVRETPWIRPTKPIDGPGPCGADLPLKVSAFRMDPQTLAAFAQMPANASFGNLWQSQAPQVTTIKPEVTMGCPLTAWTDDWIAGAVQPAALAWFGQPVKEIRTAGAYACRRRNHNPNARLSEHAFGNAIDVMAFQFNDDTIVTVKGGWRGTQQEQGFLRDVLHGACQRFKTVMGPGSDALHYDHFHLDLARHDAKGQRRYCKPRVDPPMRPMAGSFAQGLPPVNGAYAGMIAKPAAPPSPVLAQRPPAQGKPEAFQEVEEEFDPSEFDITAAVADLPRPRHLPPAEQSLPQRSAPILAPAGRRIERAPSPDLYSSNR